jgi:large subunit ribosomal protein L5e
LVIGWNGREAETDGQVVRITNKQVICQIVYAKLQGDFVLTHASSKELPKYGIEHGLTNWTAAYATGLLVARRALTKLGLADKYEGVVEPTGELELVQPCKPYSSSCAISLTSSG